MNKSALYDFDVTTVKQYNDYLYRVCTMGSVRKIGIEVDKQLNYSPKNSVNDSKLSNNISRARTTVQEYTLCNPWSYFVTLTIDPQKYDRYNLKEFHSAFAKFLHNTNRRRAKENKIKYLLIPELHQDGAWHMHGVLYGLLPSDLKKNKNGYLTWQKYNDRFGFMSIDAIKDVERVSSYILKYINKDMEKSVIELGAHLYYSSKGLNKAETVFRGHAYLHCPYDYEHPDGYCKIKTFDTRKDNIMNYLELME